MPSPKGDPTYIKDKDHYFTDIALAIAKASTHPSSPGGCVIVRNRELIGCGRSLLTDSGVEVDCVSYAIGAAARSGIPAIGGTIYTTRYPFSASVFQAHIIGIKKFVVLSHDWETYYKDEFRRAARLARELQIAVEPIHLNEDPRFTTNTYDKSTNQVLYSEKNPYSPDEYDSDHAAFEDNENSTSI